MSTHKNSDPDHTAHPRTHNTPDGAYDMRIARDGTWFYHGSPIGRIALVKLFASVLSRDEAGDYWLITPAERGRITVEDSPFIAVEVKAAGAGEDQTLSFRTNLDDWVTAGPDHPIRISGASMLPDDDTLSGASAPYILIRNRLEARIARPVFYELVALAVERPVSYGPGPHGTELGLWSNRVFFPLGIIPSTDAAS